MVGQFIQSCEASVALKRKLRTRRERMKRGTKKGRWEKKRGRRRRR